MLEDGEISDSSMDLPSSTTDPKNAPLPQRQANHRPSKRSSSITKDPEESFIEMFITEPDSLNMNGVKSAIQKKKPFTGWTQQLLEEKQGNAYKPTKKVVIIDPKKEYESAKLHHNRNGKPVIINHRLLEKKLFGEFAKNSPPKPTGDHDGVMDKFAKNIAASLKEKRQDIVRKVVNACGFQKTSDLCTEALLIHSTIGMQTIDGKPRTLGGCFFQLVKARGNLSEQQKKEIFYEPTTQLSLRKKQMRNAKKKMKKQLKLKNHLEELFEQMNLDIAVRLG